MLKYFDESGPETFFRYRKPNSALLLCWCQSRLTSFPLTQLNPDWHQHGQTQPPALLKSFSLQNPIKFVARANISLETPGVAKSCLAGLTRAARGKTSEDITHVQVCQCSRLLENISLLQTAPKLSHGGGLFLCKGRAPMPVLMSKLCQACFHGGSRGKGSAHGVAMDLCSSFCRHTIGHPCQRRAIWSTPLLCHEQWGRLWRGTELWFPGVFLPALTNKWLSGSLTSKLVLPIPFRVIFANPLTSHKSHSEQGRKDLRELCRKKQTNKPFTASYSSITDYK